MALSHMKPGEVVHLHTLESDARSIALVKTDQFEAIHLVLPAGSTIPAHRVRGQATLQCLSGQASLALDDKDISLKAGDWLYLGRAEEHSLRGLEDAALLLTILFDSSRGTEPGEGSASKAELGRVERRQPAAEDAANGRNKADMVADLLSEHDHIRAVLRIFKQELERFSRAEEIDYEVLEGSISYCRDYLDQWHHAREDALLGAVVRRQPNRAQSLQEMESQHAGLARSTSSLALIFRDVADRGAIYLREDLVNAGVALISSYDHHLEWEETRFFPTAREVLSAADWEQLSSLPAGPGDPLLATRVEQKYRALVSALSDGQISQ